MVASLTHFCNQTKNKQLFFTLLLLILTPSYGAQLCKKKRAPTHSHLSCALQKNPFECAPIANICQ